MILLVILLNMCFSSNFTTKLFMSAGAFLVPIAHHSICRYILDYFCCDMLTLCAFIMIRIASMSPLFRRNVLDNFEFIIEINCILSIQFFFRYCWKCRSIYSNIFVVGLLIELTIGSTGFLFL